jgi:starch synthase
MSGQGVPVPLAAGGALSPDVQPATHHFLFVVERTAGQRGYLANLTACLRQTPWVDAAVVRTRSSSLSIFGLKRWSAAWSARTSITEGLRRSPPDAVFVHVRSASFLSRQSMQQLPTVLSIEATPRNYWNLYASGRAAWRWPLLREPTGLLTRRIYQAANAIVTWSHWSANSLISDYAVHPPRIHVIRPGVDLGLFRPPGRRPSFGKLRIVFVGERFVEEGGPNLLAALGQLSQECELDIVTESEVGPVQAGLSYRIHRGIGAASPELVALYSGADVFVMLGRGGVGSSAIAEALACGLPVVATPTGAIPEMVVDGVNGFLVTPAHPAQLGRALEALSQSSALRESMGDRSLRLARKEHDAKANTAAILEVLVRAATARTRSHIVQ